MNSGSRICLRCNAALWAVPGWTKSNFSLLTLAPQVLSECIIHSSGMNKRSANENILWQWSLYQRILILFCPIAGQEMKTEHFCRFQQRSLSWTFSFWLGRWRKGIWGDGNPANGGGPRKGQPGRHRRHHDALGEQGGGLGSVNLSGDSWEIRFLGVDSDFRVGAGPWSWWQPAAVPISNWFNLQ